MIIRTACVFFVLVFGADTLPFLKINHLPRSARPIYGDQNFRRLDYSPRYTVLRNPNQRSSILFSGQPITSNYRLVAPFRVSLNQYLDNYNRLKEEKMIRLEQRISDSIERHENHAMKSMKRVKEMLHDKFRLFGGTMDRLKQTFKDKIIQRDEFVAVPYHTMNDDHKIVKKPGVDNSVLYSESNNLQIPTPILTITEVQSIGTQHAIVPEVTTSVISFQESETPVTVAAEHTRVPVTPTTYIPEVTDTIDPINSIAAGNESELNSATSSLMDVLSTVVEIEATSSPAMTIPNDEDASSIGYEDATIVEIGATVTFIPETRPVVVQTIFMDPGSTETWVEATEFSTENSSWRLTDSEISSSIPGSTYTTEEIITGVSSTISTPTTVISQEIDTTTVLTEETETLAPEIPALVDSVTKNTEYNSLLTSVGWLETQNEAGTTIPIKTNEMITESPTTVDHPKMQLERTTESIPTILSTILMETTESWQEITAATSPSYDHSSINEETTIEDSVSTVSSAISVETTTTVTEESFYSYGETVNSAIQELDAVTEEMSTGADPTTIDSSIYTKETTEIVSMLPSTFSNEATTISLVENVTAAFFPNDSTISSTVSTDMTTSFEGIFDTTTSSPIDSFANNEETTVQVVPRFPSTDETETTSSYVVNDVLSLGVGQTAAENDVYLPSTILTETTTDFTAESTTIDPEFISSTIQNIEMVSNLPTSTVSNPTDPNSEEISTTTLIYSDYSTLDDATNRELILQSSSTIPTATSTEQPDTVFDDTTIEWEKTTEIVSTYPPTISSESSASWVEILTTDSPYDVFTTDKENVDDTHSTFSYQNIVETITVVPETSTGTSAIDADTTTEIGSTLSSPTSAGTTESSDEMDADSTNVPLGRWSTDGETTEGVFSTFYSTFATESTVSIETTTNSEETWTDGVADQTSSEVGSTLSADVSTETTDLPAYNFSAETNWNSTDIPETIRTSL